MRQEQTVSAGTLYIANKGEFEFPNGAKEFSDRYDGEDFVFPVGEAVPVPMEAARHIFGYGEADKSRALRRQGVLAHSTDKGKANKWLDNFAFELVQPPPPPDILRKAPR